MCAYNVSVAPRDVVDLLADEPPETLAAMLASVQSKLAHLTIEAQLIEAAQAKQSRRNRSGGGSGGSRRLTKEQVFAVVDRSDEPMSPAQVHEALKEQGLPASLNSVRNHLARLVDQHGWLRRTDDGRFVGDPEPVVRPFVPAAADFPAATADEDIPF